MKLAICGSRDLAVSQDFLIDIILEFNLANENIEVVSGGADGIDRRAKMFANKNSLKYTEFPADWDQYGKSAGPRRNRQIAAYSDALLLIWDGSSPGSKSVKSEFLKLKKPVYEVILKRNN